MDEYRSADEWLLTEERVIKKGERPAYFMVQPGEYWEQRVKVAVFHVSQTAPVEEYRGWIRYSTSDFYRANKEARELAESFT